MKTERQVRIALAKISRDKAKGDTSYTQIVIELALAWVVDARIENSAGVDGSELLSHLDSLIGDEQRN